MPDETPARPETSSRESIGSRRPLLPEALRRSTWEHSTAGHADAVVDADTRRRGRGGTSSGCCPPFTR